MIVFRLIDMRQSFVRFNFEFPCAASDDAVATDHESVCSLKSLYLDAYVIKWLIRHTFNLGYSISVMDRI